MKQAGRFLQRNNIFLIFLVVFLYGILGVRHFAKPGNLYNIVMNTCLYGIPAIGMTFIMLTGNIDLSLGRQTALCAIIACMSANQFGFFPALLITLLFGIAVGYLNGSIVTRLQIDPLISTLGMQIIILGASLIITNEQTISNTDPILRDLFGSRLFGFLPAPLLIFLILMAAAVVVLKRTPFGIDIYVVGGNREAGRLTGVNVQRLQRLCFAIAGLCAGIGGIVLASRVNSGSSILGNTLNLTTISSCVIGGVSFAGGKGEPVRMITGVLVIQTINDIMTLKGVVASMQVFVTGLVLVLVLILDRYTSMRRQRALA